MGAIAEAEAERARLGPLFEQLAERRRAALLGGDDVLLRLIEQGDRGRQAD